MTRILCLIALLFLGLQSQELYAQKAPQKSWKKLKKEAEEFEKLGDLGRAALYYESAYSQKNDKKELVYKAGKCYLETRDYANAVKCLVDVKDMNNENDFDKPGYKYALALKQTGQYEEAKTAFNDFVSNYKGDDRELMRDVVDTEIQGCNFALKAQEYTNPNTSILHLDPNVNTDKTEFAPIPFNNDVLYFSSTVSGVSKIYRTQKRKSSGWMTRQVPTIFVGKTEKPHFGNGSFTPDGKRFFFTQCDLVEGGKPKCSIYLMFEEGGSWSAPVKLPDYINAEGANTTHPYVTIVADKEVLYFASDREGGKGGLDLWYCTRDKNSEGNNFTLPKNLGHNINTEGDEISPHYHAASQILYFSSNSRISAGGFDVFKSKGAKMKWEVAQNMGFPINSSADDLYFVISEAHGGGYLVSNRTYDPDKVSTTNDDIFYFGEEKVQLVVKGSIFAAEDLNKAPLKDINIKLFEVIDGMEELIQDRMLAVGDYKFTLEADKKYLLEAKVEGFEIMSKSINTEGVSEQEVRVIDLAMELPKQKVEVDPMYVVVPPEYDDRDHVYQLPFEPPTDPDTGEPYAKGTDVYKAFLIAEARAEESPNRAVYWNNKELVPYMDALADNPKTVDPRFLIVPKEYDNASTGYELPNEVPTNPETGEAFAEGSEGYEIYMKAKTLAEESSEGKVYWDGEELKAVPEPVASNLDVDPRYVVVPEEYNDRDNSYALPEEAPIDPNTGEPYAPGTDVYDAYIKSDEVAKQSPDRRVYWDGQELIPNMGDIAKEDPGIFEHYDPTPPAPQGVAYKIQVSAVRKYRAYKYTELQEGPLSDYQITFEEIDAGITRVVIIPKNNNEDGTEGFKSKADALNILSYILDHTRFKTAFVARYEAGERVGKGFRGMEEEETE